MFVLLTFSVDFVINPSKASQKILFVLNFACCFAFSFDLVCVSSFFIKMGDGWSIILSYFLLLVCM